MTLSNRADHSQKILTLNRSGFEKELTFLAESQKLKIFLWNIEIQLQIRFFKNRNSRISAPISSYPLQSVSNSLLVSFWTAFNPLLIRSEQSFALHTLNAAILLFLPNVNALLSLVYTNHNCKLKGASHFFYLVYMSRKAVLFTGSFRVVFLLFADSRRKNGFQPVKSLRFCVGQQKKNRSKRTGKKTHGNRPNISLLITISRGWKIVTH